MDITTGLGMAKESSHPDQNTTILTIWSWISSYGNPIVIQSDQGTHFTGQKVQRLAQKLNIIWEFHKAYTPTATGAIERWNGLLKIQMLSYKDKPFAMALKMAVYELNNRPRAYRKSPIQEVIEQEPLIEYIKTENKNLVRDSNCLHRDRKTNRLSKAEIIAQGEGNNVWITKGKADLQQARLEDIA